MLLKAPKQKLGLVKKTEILLKLMNREDITGLYQGFTAYHMQELRNFLEKEVIYLSSQVDKAPLTLADIKSHLEPVSNYYHKQDCREPLDACFNETCLASNPICFSNKMRTQLDRILKLLSSYLVAETTAADL